MSVTSCISDEPITLSEQSYRLLVSNCVWCRNLNNEAVLARVGLSLHREIKYVAEEIYMHNLLHFYVDFSLMRQRSIIQEYVYR